jgi:hypothetical protein
MVIWCDLCVELSLWKKCASISDLLNLLGSTESRVLLFCGTVYINDSTTTNDNEKNCEELRSLA